MEQNTTIETINCLECEKKLEPEQMVTTDDGTFCKECYAKLIEQVTEVIKLQNQNINYPLAIAGALAGGAVGILVQWSFTYFTQIAFGLIAIVIGITVAKGIAITTGNKRSIELQILAIIVTIISFFYAEYLVTRSFLIKENAEFINTFAILPDIAFMINVNIQTFDVMSLIFLAIAVWQAWKITAPVSVPGE